MPDINIDEGLYKELKLIAIKRNKTVSELVDECLKYAVALRFGMHDIDRRVSR